MRRWHLLVLAFVVAGASPGPALAQQPPAPQQPVHPNDLPRRQANYAWAPAQGAAPTDQGLLRASFSYRDVLADPALLKKLSSGLPMLIVMRAYVYREGDDLPVALASRWCRVNYDLWDEVYRVHVSEPEGDRDQPTVLQGALRLCTEPQNLPVVRRELLTAGQAYFLGVVVYVNPVSQDMMEQMRRWIARPIGSTGIGEGAALFGGFVQLFVRQIAQSDKTITFRTQSVVP